jgi:Ca2+-binding RTX toxin-like protein
MTSPSRHRIILGVATVLATSWLGACAPPAPTPVDPCPASEAPDVDRWFVGTDGPDLIQIDNASSSEDIAICLKGGNDLVELMDGAVFGRIIVWGGDGDDRVVDGSAPSGSLGEPASYRRIDAQLGTGNDQMILIARPQQFEGVDIDAGNGDDVIWLVASYKFPARGFATVTTGEGNDLVRVNVRSVNVDTGSGADQVELSPHYVEEFGGYESAVNRQVTLGPGDDTAVGSPANDRISGGDGNDSIVGGGTYRYIALGYSGTEPDSRSEVLYGDAGNDTIRLFSGGLTTQYDSAVVSGGDGDDVIDTTSTNTPPQILWADSVDGGLGSDSCAIDPSDFATNC